jgi:hypothetical protein
MSSKNITISSAPQPDEAQQKLITNTIILYSYNSFVLFLSCCGLLAFYSALQRVKFKLSGQLSIHIFFWLVSGAFSLLQWIPILLSLTTCEFSLGFSGRVGFNAVKI